LATRQPTQRHVSGGYVASAAHDMPPPNNLPPPIGASEPLRDAPASEKKLGGNQNQQPQTALGTTAPAQSQPQTNLGVNAPTQSPPMATIDRVAPVAVPPPTLGDATWSKTFPGDSSPAAFQLTQQGYDRLREANNASTEWMGDQAKDKSRERIIEHLPLSEGISGEINATIDQLKKFKTMFEDKRKSASEYVTGYFHYVSKWIDCEGHGRINCEEEASANVESVQKKYGDKESERWQSWSHEDARKP
jgi:hypothetical protein